MTYQNIDSAEERVFPYYKGKYMGKENVGYANVKAARKFMRAVPKKDVMDECFGGEEAYRSEHTYLYPLKSAAYSSWWKSAVKLFPDIQDADISGKPTYLKDLEEPVRTRIVEDCSKINIHNPDREMLGRILEFQRTYNLFPSLYLDVSDYNRAYSRYVTEHVEFKKGVLYKKIEIIH